MAQDRYEIGTIPPLGEVPPSMYAQVIRPDRFGEPKDAFRVETVETPLPGPGEAVVLRPGDAEETTVGSGDALTPLLYGSPL